MVYDEQSIKMYMSSVRKTKHYQCHKFTTRTSFDQSIPFSLLSPGNAELVSYAILLYTHDCLVVSIVDGSWHFDILINCDTIVTCM